MKFSQLRAFEKHLEQAAPNHLADVYLIMDSDLYAQKKWASKVAQFLPSLEKYDAEWVTLKDIKALFETRSLFDPVKQCVLYQIEKLPKNALNELQKFIESPHSDVRLILTSSTANAFCQKIAKHVVALDLVSEKPWDKEARLVQYVAQTLHQSGFRISSSLAQQIVSLCHGSLSFLDQELEKLICYSFGKKEITRDDLQLLKIPADISIFKVAEAVLEGSFAKALALTHQQTFQTMPLIYALRSVLQKSLRLKELSRKEIEQAYPKLKGKWLEKNLQQLSKVSTLFLQKALTRLFELEVLFKSQTVSEKFMQSLCILNLGECYESLPT